MAAALPRHPPCCAKALLAALLTARGSEARRLASRPAELLGLAVARGLAATAPAVAAATAAAAAAAAVATPAVARAAAAARPAAIKKKRSTTADSSDEDYSEEDSGDEQGKLIAGSSSRKRKRRKVSASTTTLTQSRFRPQAERCLIVRSRRRLRGSHVVSEAKSPTAPSLPCRWAQRKSSKREERG